MVSDEELGTILKNPVIGTMKKGYLKGVHVYKYKHNSQQYLLAYQYVEDKQLLTLLALGAPENLYRNLKLRA